MTDLASQPEYVALKTELNEKMAELKSQMKKLGEDYFKTQSSTLFKMFPNLAEFSWTQYTPYFNDGDVCEFSVHSDWPSATYTDGTNVDELYVPYNTSEEDYTEEHKLAEAITSLLRGVDEDVMLDLFGDHVKVTVSRNGVTVDDYDHE